MFQKYYHKLWNYSTPIRRDAVRLLSDYLLSKGGERQGLKDSHFCIDMDRFKKRKSKNYFSRKVSVLKCIELFEKF